jgi:hypothetical protein
MDTYYKRTTRPSTSWMWPIYIYYIILELL